MTENNYTLPSGAEVDPRRYMTDESYRAAIDSKDEQLLSESDEHHQWLLSLDGAPVLADQFYSIAQTSGRPSGYRPAVMGEWIHERRPMAMGTNGVLYGCGSVGSGKGVYEPCESWVEFIVQKSQGDHYQNGTAGQTLNWLKKENGLYPVDFTQPLPGGLVNVKNGMLDPLTGVLVEHDCAFLSSYQIPVVWDEKSDCPKIDKFLEDCCPDDPDTIQLIWEMIGYTLFGQGNRQKYFILRGPGGNGKSVLLWMLTNLIGRKFVQSSSINELCDNRFRAAGLYGKRANICGDIGKKAVVNTDTLKKLTGNDTIEAEHKGQDPFSFVNKAVLIFSANNDPILLDKSQGMEDRSILINMPIKFRGTDREDSTLFSKLVHPDELQGALVKAAAAFAKLEANDAFTIPEASLKLKNEMRASNSNAIRFWDENVYDTKNNSVMVFSKSAVFIGYKNWCAENGNKPMGKKAFWEDIDKISKGAEFRETNTSIGGNSVRLMTGFALTRDGEETVAHMGKNILPNGGK